MKNIITYSIILLFFTFSSCVKEADILSEDEPEVIIQNGETRLLTGLVRDTSGTFLPEVGVKLVLDELELETESDENGEWHLLVPNSLTEGFVVANKVDYSKSIQRFKETADNRVEDIYLAIEQSNTEQDLSFSASILKTVIGRIIDINNNPIPDVSIYLGSVLDGPPIEYVFHGITQTDEAGTFEIIYEDEDYSATNLAVLYSGGCSDHLSITLDGQESVEDLGDLELDYEAFSTFETTLESDGSSCYDNVQTLAYVYDLEAAFTENSYNQPLGNISLAYCLNEDAAIYVGVESEDNIHFNGSFVSPTEAEVSYQFDICTPNPGNFLELSIDGNVALYEDNLTCPSPGTFVSQNVDASLAFQVLSWVTYTPTGQISPAYQIGKLSSFALSAASGLQYNLDEDSSENYVNVVQDDIAFFSGIVQAEVLANDGTLATIDIRFRVAK